MKNQKIDEILNSTLEVNKRKGSRSDILDRKDYSNVMFISSDPDKANEVIKSYLEDEFGATVITVTPDGYEIQKEKANIQVGCVSTAVIYPGDEMTDKLKKEDTVLFLPDLDQMEDVRYGRLLFDMINYHFVADPRNGEYGFTELDGSFFAVATVSNGRKVGVAIREFRYMDEPPFFRRVDLDEITIDD